MAERDFKTVIGDISGGLPGFTDIYTRYLVEHGAVGVLSDERVVRSLKVLTVSELAQMRTQSRGRMNLFEFRQNIGRTIKIAQRTEDLSEIPNVSVRDYVSNS